MEAVTTCPVCFEDLKDKETASPDVCDHTFCLLCLQKWAKQGGSFCPVDRKRFRKIIDLSTSAPIQIKPRKRKRHRELYDISVHCEVCSKANNSDTLLLCDCCDLGYHCKCLFPPLKAVPPGIWNCPVCVAVAEKLRSKKGISKEVENIAIDHTNQWDSYSSDSNSSYDNIQELKNKCALKNDSRNKCSITVNSTIGNPGSSSASSDTLGDSRSQHSLRTSSKLRSLGKELSRVKNLRPRNRKIKYTICSSRSSSESTESAGCFERSSSSSSTVCKVKIKLPPRLKNGRFSKGNSSSGHNNSICNTSDEDDLPRNHGRNKKLSESWNGRKTLRKRHFKSHQLPQKIRRHDSSYSNSSENSSVLERKRKCFSNKNHKSFYIHSDESNNSTQSKSLDLTEDENVNSNKVNDVILCTSSHGEDAVEENTSNITIIKCKKKSNCHEVLANSTEIPVMQEISGSQALQYSENKIDDSFRETPLPFLTESHRDKIRNISDSTKENLTYSKPLQMDADGEKLLERNSHSEDLLILNEIAFSDSELLHNDSNHSSYDSKNVILNKSLKAMPVLSPEISVFSVFEKLDDTSVSEEKYSNINVAVTESFHNSKNVSKIIKDSQENSQTLSSQYSNVHHNFKDNLNYQNNSPDPKILNISKELREIEREKWKTFHLRKNPKVSSEICCSTLDRLHPYMCNTMEVGKHCLQSKYSDNYNRFLSIAKSLRKKSWHDKYDSAIIPSLDVMKLIKKRHGHTPNNNPCIHRLCSTNNFSLSPQTSLNFDFNYHEKHPAIVIETKEFIHLKETESELLHSIVCFNDINKLSVRNDGSLFIDWHHS